MYSRKLSRGQNSLGEFSMGWLSTGRVVYRASCLRGELSTGEQSMGQVVHVKLSMGELSMVQERELSIG